eukprot:SAG25_NODE_5920_length_606_cov_0.788955_1_plen_59_part_01
MTSPIDAPCTQCVRHGDPMHVHKWCSSKVPRSRSTIVISHDQNRSSDGNPLRSYGSIHS